MTAINNNYSLYLDMVPLKNKIKGLKPDDIEFSIRVKDSDGKIVDSMYRTVAKGILTVNAHPEAKPDDFVRYGNGIEDPIERFIRRDAIEQFGYKNVAKALDAKNEINKELRVFDNIELSKAVISTLDEMKRFISGVCQKYSLDSKAVKKEITRANKALRASLNKIA